MISYKLDPELKMQPRKVRVRSWMWMSVFVAWYIGGMLFITYRMKGDDLDELEMEAEKRMRLSKVRETL